MFRTTRSRVIPLVAVALIACTGNADAGWVTIKNDTTKTLVLQETVTVDGKVKYGTAVRLLPGETVREFRATPAVKTVVVCDCAKPGVAIFRGDLNCTEDSQTFSITHDGKTTTLKAAKPATVVVKK
jgi:hypothetical protein